MHEHFCSVVYEEIVTELFAVTDITAVTMGCTLKEEQPLRLLLNFFFCHFNRSEPSYKSQPIKHLAMYNQLNVNDV